MILETLRSAVILGTVLANGVSLGTPAAHLDLAIQQTVPVIPVSREMTRLRTFPGFGRAEAVPAKLPTKIRKLRTTVVAGLATWYGKVLENHKTASGELFDPSLLTGASNTLPMGTRVKVTNLRTGQSVIVKVNDRGILSPGRIIDLSSAAADAIGMLRMGVAPVRLDIVKPS